MLQRSSIEDLHLTLGSFSILGTLKVAREPVPRLFCAKPHDLAYNLDSCLDWREREAGRIMINKCLLQVLANCTALKRRWMAAVRARWVPWDCYKTRSRAGKAWRRI